MAEDPRALLSRPAMHSLQPAFLERLILPPRVAVVLRRLGEHKGRQELYRKQAPEMLENLRRVALIESTESSNRLEGIVASDDKRLHALVSERSQPADRNEAEIAGYRDVLDTVHQNHSHIPFTDRVVLQLHRDLLKYADDSGGRWKSAANDIRETLPDGTQRVRFQPLAPHLTEDAMRDLHHHYTRAVQEGVWDPLLLIPFYLLDFLCIHPFSDGNGRLSRLLSLLALYHQGYEVGRFISLERVIEKTKESYYDTLLLSSRHWHEARHDPWPWTEYFLSTLLAASSEFESRFSRISTGRGSKTDTVHNAITALIGDFSLTDLEKACPLVSRDMIRRVLADLRKTGHVECLGRGPSARWRKKM
jgi:Fic family protein